MKLPTEKTKAVNNTEQLCMLIYGDPGIGKSTFCSQFPKALFLATERGLDCLDTYQIPITTVAEIKEAGKLLRTEKNEFKTIIIDTLDRFYEIVRQEVLRDMGITHESEDKGHGRVYSMIYQRFYNLVDGFKSLPYGVVMVAHGKQKQETDRLGQVQYQTVPSVPEKALSKIIADIPLILYLDYAVDETGKDIRVIRAQPTQSYLAKDRTGKLPDTLPLDYKIFKEYFKNE